MLNLGLGAVLGIDLGFGAVLGIDFGLGLEIDSEKILYTHNQWPSLHFPRPTARREASHY